MKFILFTAAIMLCILLPLSLAAVAPYQTATAVGVTLNYRVTDNLQSLDCQIIAPTTGWCAIGFENGVGMTNANIIIGYNVSGVTHIRDDFGTSAFTHASDVSLGGVDNVTNASSTESGGSTQLNFLIPLNSGDTFDHLLVIGQSYSISLGYGPNGSDDFADVHATFGLTTVNIVNPVAVDDNMIPVPASAIKIITSPNPCTNSLHIAVGSDAKTPVGLQIFDLRGRLLKAEKITNTGNLDWDVSSWGAGVYFIKADTGLASKTVKVLKTR